MSAPYYADDFVTLHHGDCREVLAKLPERSVQTCVTSPPYYGLRSYGYDHQIGLEPTPDAYVAELVAVFREVRRVLRDDGTLWLNLGPSYASGDSAPTRVRRGRNARACDIDGTEPQGSRGPGSSYSGLCDGCLTALSIGTAHSIQRTDGYAEPPCTTGHDTVRQGSVAALPAASPLDVPESTSSQFSAPPRGECSHCDNCGACLDVLRSVSRDARLCARKVADTSDRADTVSAHRNQGTVSVGMAWLKYNAKPKDLIPIPWLVALALQADGWYLRSEIIWAKPNPMPESVTDRPTKAHEQVFLLSKRPTYFYDAAAIAEPYVIGNGGRQRAILSGNPDKYADASRDWKEAAVGNGHDGLTRQTYTDAGRNARTVWEIATQPYKGAHFATMPRELARRCIVAGSRPGDVVLDPFGGAGTTAFVAKEHNRRCVLIEASADYCALIPPRIRQHVLDLGGAA